jgi:predicted ABC-type ATPase
MILVCGSNGSGKSTFTYAARDDKRKNIPFIDPDRIARDKQCSPVEAGKIVSKAAQKYVEDGQSFVRESTLTAKFDFQLIQTAKRKGFRVYLTYIGLKNADIAVCRVKERHANGGHSVPEEDIRRRYGRGLKNLSTAIQLADKAVIIDNSDQGYTEVAVFENGRIVSNAYTPDWFKAPLEAVLASNAEQIQRENPSDHMGIKSR